VWTFQHTANVCAVNSLCPVCFSSIGHIAPPVHNSDHPVSNDPSRSRVSRPVKLRSDIYWHSGSTDRIHHECYELLTIQFVDRDKGLLV